MVEVGLGDLVLEEHRQLPERVVDDDQVLELLLLAPHLLLGRADHRRVVQEARGASPEFAAFLSAMAWLGLAFGAPLVNVVSNHFHSRKWSAVVGMFLEAIAVAFFIYAPKNGQGASVVIMFSVGLFAGTHMLGFTIAGESVKGSLIGSASAVVNGICFIVGGILEAVPGWFLPDVAHLGDYKGILWIMPVVLIIGGLAALALKDRAEPAATLAQ